MVKAAIFLPIFFLFMFRQEPNTKECILVIQFNTNSKNTALRRFNFSLALVNIFIKLVT